MQIYNPSQSNTDYQIVTINHSTILQVNDHFKKFIVIIILFVSLEVFFLTNN